MSSISVYPQLSATREDNPVHEPPPPEAEDVLPNATENTVADTLSWPGRGSVHRDNAGKHLAGLQVSSERERRFLAEFHRH